MCCFVDDDGQVRQRFISRQLPLGILPSAQAGVVCEPLHWDTPGPDRAVLRRPYRGGEAPMARPSDVPGLRRCCSATPRANRLKGLRQALNRHLAGHPAADDVSVLMLDCGLGAG
jgi:hypothetical protein